MKRLEVYPTGRAIRHRQEILRTQEGFAPELMTIGEFEQRAVIGDSGIFADAMQRRLLMREAARFEGFERLRLEMKGVRFLKHSDALLRFFEELSAEGVGFAQLKEADTHAEYLEQIELLEKLYERYGLLLQAKGLSDRIFLPERYRLNRAFLQNYAHITLHIEGYLTRFELSLFEEIAQHCDVEIVYETSPFTEKMQRRFEALGIALPSNHRCRFSLRQKERIETEPLDTAIKAKVIAVKERIEQIAALLIEVQRMVDRGIAPEKIAVVLPDESFKSLLMRYDLMHNFNFAMGGDFTQTSYYLRIEALYRYLHEREPMDATILERYGISVQSLQEIAPTGSVTQAAFISLLQALELWECKEADRYFEEARTRFVAVTEAMRFALPLWLYLWKEQLSTLRIDDVHGGKITVMGLLETRASLFDGVIVVDFNEGVVPTTTSKDRFLNSRVRHHAGLPSRQEREALQKHYYWQLLRNAKEATILYSLADSRSTSRFLYELGLEERKTLRMPMSLLYPARASQTAELIPHEVAFSPTSILWSPSKFKCFLGCKRQFYYRYIARIPPKEKEELDEGTLLHRLLQTLYAHTPYHDDEKAFWQAFDAALEQHFAGDDAKTLFQKHLMREKLSGFAAQEIAHFKEGWRVEALEKPIEGQIGGLRFKGRCDRIDRRGKSVMLIDYKSGEIGKAQKPKSVEHLIDFQMSIYRLLLSKEQGEVACYFVQPFKKPAYTPLAAPEEKEARLLTLIEEIAAMRSFVPEKCEDLSYCTYCDYRLACERGEYL